MRACVATAALLLFGAGERATAEGTLQVSARIQRHATIRVAPPTELVITEADLARGYVVVETPLQVAVRSNVRQGYTLVFARDGEQVDQVHVDGLQEALTVGAGGASTMRPAAGTGLWNDVLQLRLRFDLSAAARPGRHPWPLHISMMAL